MSTKQNEIRTKRLILRPLEDGDRDALIRMAKDDRIRQTYMLPDFATSEQEDAFFRRMKDISRSDEHFLYGISLNGVLIGIINDCMLDGTEAELGYFISPEYWGHGYASEALLALISELFRLGYSRVMTGYFEGNEASRRVMEKCGMHPLEKEETVAYRGRKHRCFYYGLEAKQMENDGC